MTQAKPTKGLKHSPHSSNQPLPVTRTTPTRPVGDTPSTPNFVGDRHSKVIANILDHISDDDFAPLALDPIGEDSAGKTSEISYPPDHLQCLVSLHDDTEESPERDQTNYESEVSAETEPDANTQSDTTELKEHEWKTPESKGQPKTHKETALHRKHSPRQVSSLAVEETKRKLIKLQEKYLSQRDPFKVYAVKDKIGAGSAGEVVFGETAQGQKVAIKKLQLVRKGKNRLEFILREIEIIATSRHPNIVLFIEAFHMGEELWVVMEFMSGGSLYDLLKLFSSGFRFTEEEVAYVIVQCLQAIAYLHSMRRIHRDIKVDNILFAKEGTIKLADFGTAVQLTISHLKRTTLAGTPYYMAPELIQRLPYSEKVDIWSIGITVVEMINGEPPYYDMDPHDALNAIIESKGKTIGLNGPSHSPQILDFVNIKCLNFDPLARATASELLQHEFTHKACTIQEFSKKVCSTGGEQNTNNPNGCTLL